MFKWISSLLCFLFFLGSISFAFAAPFTDIDEGSKYTDALEFLKERQVIQGYDDGTFRPQVIVNRVEAIKMLLVASGLASESSLLAVDYEFPDVEQGAWYMDYLDQAVQLGMVQGYPDGLFRPGQPINRVEALKISFHTFGIETDGIEVAEQLYTDIPLNADTQWFQKLVAYARAANLLEPKKTGIFAPSDGMTRGDMAELLYRIMYIQENKKERFTSGYSGEISYYADQFEGRGTAYGETFRQEVFSAANMTYPHGTFIQIVDHNTDKSVVAKINDKGPFSEGRIVDLSRVSFAALGSLSRGISQGEIRRLFQQVELDKQIIAKTAYAGVRLDRGIPNMMQQGEYYRISGTVAGESLTVHIRAGSKVVWTETIAVHNGKFSVGLPFVETGTMSVTLTTEAGQATTQNVHVIAPVLGTMELTNAKAPEQLRVTNDGDVLRFAWEGHGQSLFRIVFYQDSHRVERFINGAPQFVAKMDEFAGFQPGTISWYVEAAVASTVFSHDRYSTWAPSATIDFQGVARRLSQYTPAITGVRVSGEGRVEGVVQEVLSPIGYVTLPSGKVETLSVPMVTNLALTLPNAGEGTYLLELRTADHQNALLLPVYVGNTYPIFAPNVQGIEVTMLDMVPLVLNTERAGQGTQELTKSSELAAFGEIALREGLQQATTTKDGFTGQEIAELYGLMDMPTVLVSSGSTLHEQVTTLITTPHMRRHVIDASHTHLGVSSVTNGNALLAVIGNPATATGSTLMAEMIAELGVRAGQSLGYDLTLERIATLWARTMATENFFALEQGTKSLAGIVQRFSFPKSVKTYILTASSPTQLQEKILELTTLRSEQVYTRIGIGIHTGKNGLLTATVLYY